MGTASQEKVKAFIKKARAEKHYILDKDYHIARFMPGDLLPPYVLSFTHRASAKNQANRLMGAYERKVRGLMRGVTTQAKVWAIIPGPPEVKPKKAWGEVCP
jgi:hypothetical protein